MYSLKIIIVCKSSLKLKHIYISFKIILFISFILRKQTMYVVHTMYHFKDNIFNLINKSMIYNKKYYKYFFSITYLQVIHTYYCFNTLIK